MQRISQVGKVMAHFGDMMTALSHAVEDEITVTIRNEQLQAEDQLNRTVNDANAKLADQQAAIESACTQLLRSNQQLKVAADKIVDLEEELLLAKQAQAGLAPPLDHGSTVSMLHAIDWLNENFKSHQNVEIRANAKSIIANLTEKVNSLSAAHSEIPAPAHAKKPAPKLADVAQKVAGTVGAAGDANVPELPVTADAAPSPTEA